MGSCLLDRVSLSSPTINSKTGKLTKTTALDTKPYFLTSLTTSYCPDDKSEITLTINNVLNRQNNTAYTNVPYYDAPINYMLSYTQKF